MSYLALVTPVFVPMFLLAAAGLTPAFAQTPPPSADHLLPLESQALGVEVDPALFQAASDRINATVGSGQTPKTGENELDLSTLPIVRSFLDENGNVKLPLGITVFSTLGDPSIGFGGSF